MTELMEPLLETVSRIIRDGQNSNSYKLALRRALAESASRDTKDRGTITRERLAECFVSYDWDLTLTYQVRRRDDPKQRLQSNAAVKGPAQEREDFRKDKSTRISQDRRLQRLDHTNSQGGIR